MQRWIVQYFLQAGSVWAARLVIDMPIFCQEQRSIPIVICDVECSCSVAEVGIGSLARLKLEAVAQRTHLSGDHLARNEHASVAG
jgi:hypothetical protein